MNHPPAILQPLTDSQQSLQVFGIVFLIAMFTPVFAMFLSMVTPCKPEKESK